MVSAFVMKSFKDLKKRKSRTIFTLLTIALAVAALSMFAVMPLMDQAMANEIDKSNLHDVKVYVNDIELNETTLQGLENIDNVNSIEPKYVYYTRMYIGERRNDVMIVGVNDYDNQNVNIVNLENGRNPVGSEVITDKTNQRSGLYNGGFGDKARIYDHTGTVQELPIVGVGSTLEYTNSPTWGLAIFYTTIENVHTLSNSTGFNRIAFDLESDSQEATDRTLEDIEAYLLANTDFESYTDFPVVWVDDDYPGKEEGDNFSQFFLVLTFMTVFCSLFLISNTMHTMITEQRKEIAQMKAVGATKLQVFQSYLTTSTILGTAGSIVGVGIGIGIAYAMVSFIAKSFYGITPAFSIYLPAVLASLGIGVLITVIATLPGLIKGMKITAREGMQDSGLSGNYGGTFIDKALMKLGFMPRSTQMGFRNIARKKGRSISTILQVALAVGMFIGIVTFGHSLSEGVSAEYGYFTLDIMAQGSLEGGKLMTEDLQYTIEGIDNVSQAEPFVVVPAVFGEEDIIVFSYVHDPIAFNIEETLVKGRSYTEEELNSNASVVLLSKTMARLENKKVGDMIDLELPTGVHQFKVIGIERSQMMNGRHAIVPLNTMQEKMNLGNVVNGFAIVASSKDHKVIDKVSSDLEDVMINEGYVVSNEVMYVAEQQNTESNDKIIQMMIAFGTLIIGVTMIGLMSTLTMNIIERTKEIGMLRCVGSSSWSVRNIFGTEGLVLALAGWILGIPIGYAVGTFINYMTYELLAVELTYLFPAIFVVVSLVVTVAVTLIVIQPPLFRAVHFRPGDALRYE